MNLWFNIHKVQQLQ